MRFFPDFAMRDLFGWILALGVLAACAALFPWELGEKADPFAPAYKDIRPEWYFVFMFETLKLVPGGEAFGIEYEAIPILLFGFVGLVLVLVPFLDGGGKRDRAFAWIGALSVLYVLAMTAWGYQSMTPFWIVGATAVALGLVGLGTRRVSGSETDR